MMYKKQRSDGQIETPFLAPEEWWAELNFIERRQVQVIAEMLDEVTEAKRVEIRRVGDYIRARFVHILRQPEPGCVSAIMLPECEGASSCQRRARAGSAGGN